MVNRVSYLFIAKEQYLAVANKVAKSTKKVRQEFVRTGGVIKKFTSGFKLSSGRISAGFRNMAASAAAFFGVRGFLTLGSRFQDSLADLSAITGATGKDLDNLGKDALKMSKDAATSADEVLNAFKLVASAKPELLKNLPALKQTTEQVLLLKNAAGIELATAANFTAQSLNIFGEGADQASRFVNVLAAGAKLGSSEIRDTGEALLIAGPGARAAGLSFEQLNAAIQTTAVGGIKAQRAGTALNSIFGRLQRSGIDFQKLGLQGSFQVIKSRMDSMTDSTQRALFAAKIFGEEHSKVGFAILDNINLLGELETNLTGTNIAQEQANIRLSTFNAQARRMGATISASLIKAFVRLEPTLTRLIGEMTAFFDTINTEQVDGFVDSIKGLIEFVRSLALVFGTAFRVIKNFVEGLAEIFAALTILDFSGLGGALSKVTGLNLVLGADEGELNNINSAQASRTDVNVNLNAPEKTVESVKTVTSGKVAGLNVGVNMALQP